MDSISNFPPPRQQNLDGLNLDSKVSPSILIIIIILAIIFFICGLLHLLGRFLLRPQAREQDEMSRVTALQGQLQQLFHLHDAGLDQFFIDSTLPVFQYLDIIGSKNSKNNNINNDPFDCSVCLCEFEPEDKLRLLPKCSHAFHMECIDTWLLSHSTCPLCRASLVPDLTSQSGSNHVCSPVVFVLESGREQQSREISELGSSRVEVPTDSGEEVVAVKLGKFRNVDDPDAEGSNSNEVTRRCYSMGHFEYVMDEDSLLKVPIRAIPAAKKPCNLPLTPGQRPAMSECGCESRREFNGFEGFASLEENSRGVVGIGDANGRSKRRESYSVSKIWLRGKKEMKQSLTEGGCGGSSSRRAFSFRFPMSSSTNLSNGNGGTRRSNSETGIGSGSARLESGPTNLANAWIWENGQELASEYCFDEESGPGVDFQAKTPSFARRTLLWLVGRQSKVGNSQFTNDDF